MSGKERAEAVTGLIVLAFAVFVFVAWLAASGAAERDQRASAAEQQEAVAANDQVRFAKTLVPGAEATFESAASQPASPLPQPTQAAPRELGGEVDKFAVRFNAAAVKHESTVRLAAHGCVRSAAVTCSYMLGNVGAVALSSLDRPLGTLTWVFASDADPIEAMMAVLLTMAVFAPDQPRPAIQQAYKDLLSAWSASVDKKAEVVFRGVTYRLSASPLGVLLTVVRV